MADYSGGCLCGAIHYEIEGQPDERMQITCHCRDCQQITGAGHARSMGVRNDLVRWSGEPSVFQIQHEKSVVDTAFCGACGSPLYKRSSNMPDLIFFHVGSLDPESGCNWRPAMTVYTDRRQPWDELPALEVNQQ